MRIVFLLSSLLSYHSVVVTTAAAAVPSGGNFDASSVLPVVGDYDTNKLNHVVAAVGRDGSSYVRGSNNVNSMISKSSTTSIITGTSRDLSVTESEATVEDSTIDNPYTSGCLLLKELVSQKRVCNSEDSVEDVTSGVCRIQPDLDYMEIRIFSDNWESIVFEAWILQIVLSELLDVPTTIEAGSYKGSLNFYHRNAPMEYGTTGSSDALRLANTIGDCRTVTKDMNNYQPCTHIDPERWTGIQHNSKLRDLVHEGITEPPQSLGTLGLEGWFITKFSAVRDPTLNSYLGLMGDDNRKKLAETFLRPTSWFDYCEQISSDNCTSPDTVAQRSPETIEESEQFYLEGSYIGHFRATDDNNCTANPTTCTGHVADFPCGWNSYMLPQIHYLNIALKSTGPELPAGGYPYERLVEMWKAANATKSNLMMQYWSPEPLYQEFLGTDAEFIRVTLPTPTQSCLNSRRQLDDMCSQDESVRLGKAEGICEETSKPLWKVIVGNLYDQINDPTIPIPIRSPAYDVLSLFQISELQLGQIFDYRRTEATPRDAVCRWVSENIDYIQTFVPRSYPRTIRDGEEGISSSTNGGGGDPLIYVATILGGITSVVVIITWIMVYRRRGEHVMRMAQIEFLYLLLSGSLLIASGAIIVGLPPSNYSCTAAIWFINLGYTLELVPLIVKVAAVNKLMSAARQFRRVVLSRKTLFSAVFGISAMVSIFLLTWTVIDPPNKDQVYSLTSDVVTDMMGNNRTIVDVVYFCSSDASFWDYIAVGWNVILLLCATVLAVQTRTIQKDFNESQTLAFLIYSHFLFVVLRLILLLLSSGTSSSVSEATLSGLRSLIFSVDTMATIIIYFLPKIFASKSDPNHSIFSDSFGTGNNKFANALMAIQLSKNSKPKSDRKISAVDIEPTEKDLVLHSSQESTTCTGTSNFMNEIFSAELTDHIVDDHEDVTSIGDTVVVHENVAPINDENNDNMKMSESEDARVVELPLTNATTDNEQPIQPVVVATPV